MINILGFADAVGASGIPIGAVYIYRLNFFSGFIVSAAVYWLLSTVWPQPAQNPVGKWYEVEDALLVQEAECGLGDKLDEMDLGEKDVKIKDESV